MKSYYKSIAILSLFLISFSLHAQDTLFLINEDRLIVKIDKVINNKIVYQKYDTETSELESNTTSISLDYPSRIGWKNGESRMPVSSIGNGNTSWIENSSDTI
jgi:hypothetical protein